MGDLSVYTQLGLKIPPTMPLNAVRLMDLIGISILQFEIINDVLYIATNALAQSVFEFDIDNGVLYVTADESAGCPFEIEDDVIYYSWGLVA